MTNANREKANWLATLILPLLGAAVVYGALSNRVTNLEADDTANKSYKHVTAEDLMRATVDCKDYVDHHSPYTEAKASIETTMANTAAILTRQQLQIDHVQDQINDIRRDVGGLGTSMAGISAKLDIIISDRHGRDGRDGATGATGASGQP